VQVEVLENASIIVGLDGAIEAVDRAEVIDEKYRDVTFQHQMDARGKSIIPGITFCQC
jgi:hypothetical protein